MRGRIVVQTNELYHHGILGQKWGVRRFQNPDGTRTEAGKKREKMMYKGQGKFISVSQYKEAKERVKREGLSDKEKKQLAASLGIAAIAASAIVYAKNPDKVKNAISVGASFVKNSAKSAGNFAKEMGKATREGAKDGIKNLPNATREATKDAIGKTGKLVTTGVVMLAGKELVDQVAGKVNSEKIYKANNNKKVDSFWKVYDENFNNNKKKKRDDDDDD